MPSRDLVVQNEALKQQVKRLENEVRHLEGIIDYTRKWRGHGLGPSDPIRFFVIPDRNIGIPMTPEHCEALEIYIDWVQSKADTTW